MTLTMKKRKERAFAEHKPKWQRFQTTLMKPSGKSAAAAASKAGSTGNKPTLHPYQRQYGHVYHQRLAALKPRCWQAFEEYYTSKHNNKGGDGEEAPVQMERILELRENVRSVVVGSVVKEGGGEILHKESRCQSKQSLFIEDESGRANIAVKNVHDFCTGMVLGFQGMVGSDGIFQVEHVFYPALPPHPVNNTDTSDDAEGDKEKEKESETTMTPHLLLISGLHCGDPNVSPLRRDLLLHYLRGNFTSDAAKVAHVIIAGGSTCSTTATHNDSPTVGLKELDGFCFQVCAAGIPVDILPGKDDPTTANWPQRPLHNSLLKFTDQKLHHLLSRVPNPYGAVFCKDKYVLGTDGTNVTDLSKSLLTTRLASNSQDGNDDHDNDDANKNGLVPVSHMEALRRTLQCGHMCPTGPNTVPTMPHPESDPMVIPEAPHIYFAGNCDSFETMLVEQPGNDNNNGDIKCRLVCVPSYAETGVAVLVNLETLEAESIHIADPAI